MGKDAVRPGKASGGFALMDCLVALLVLSAAGAGSAAAAGFALRSQAELLRSREGLAALADLGELLAAAPAATRPATALAWRTRTEGGFGRTASARNEPGPSGSELWIAEITWPDRLRGATGRLSAQTLVP